MLDPMHFEANAGIYRDARPPYPPALWDAVAELGVLRPGLRALDLGAGTGQATGPLLDAGLIVTAVEPGRELADRLVLAHPGATVLVERAEDAELGENSFDLVVAATSVHWLDLGVVLPKVHRALSRGGVFLVWRNVFGDPDVETPFRRHVARIVADRGGSGRPGPHPEDPAAAAEQLTRGGMFSAAQTRAMRWSVELDDQQVLRLFTTFSDWSAEEAERAAAGVRELGGRVVEHYVTWLIALVPAADPSRTP